MAVVMAVRAELRSGRYLLIDDFLDHLLFRCAGLGLFRASCDRRDSICTVARKEPGTSGRIRRDVPRRDRAMSPDERQYWKSEAYRARLAQATEALEADRGPHASV